MAPSLIPATRSEALDALEEFASGPVLRYARLRNHIAEGHSHVSRLSAAISHRLVSEAEVLRAVLKNHKPAAVEKFLQEVCWRSYWKGWLESRPGVWRDFSDAPPSVDRLADRLCEGESGCAAMDAFARELVQTGYMHNHARMWWASFWTHRAGLTWREGARFYLDHLLDADAASNTLSWRWVAGLQTVGKTYLVRRSNLENYWPDAPTEGLDQLEGEPHIRIPPDSADRSRREIADLPESPGEGDAGLLIHEEDFSPECEAFRDFRPKAAFLWKTPPRSRVRAEWLHRASEDVRARAESHFQIAVPTGDSLSALTDWVEARDLRRIVMAAPCVGAVDDSLKSFQNWCGERDISIVCIRRRWDSKVFPFSKAGFFPFWNSLRPHLADLCK
jgi:deoxyribodipyrimidine photo-lyase